MKHRISTLILLAALLCALCLTFSSCLPVVLPNYTASEQGSASSGVSRAELDEILKNYANLGSATVNGGDTYNISVTNSGESILSASKALLSVVSVRCIYTKNVYNYWGSSGSKLMAKEYSSAGSGVIFELDKEHGNAYILTNYHVVYDADASSEGHICDNISLFLYGQESEEYAIPATYVGGSMYYDLAVLKVENNAVLAASLAAPAIFADSNDVAVLETAIAIGNPEANGLSATVGHVNVDSEYIDLSGSNNASTIRLRVMRIDAAVNGGNSGGGLFNAAGELVGIVNAKMSSSSVDNIGYAIPSNVAKAVAKNILDYCVGDHVSDRETLNQKETRPQIEQKCVYRCLVGITVTAAKSFTEYEPETCKVYKRERVTVAEVTAGGIADGKLQQDDVITSLTIDGEEFEVTRTFHVVDVMLNARIGSSVIFHIERADADGKMQKMDVPVSITADALTAY